MRIHALALLLAACTGDKEGGDSASGPGPGDSADSGDSAAPEETGLPADPTPFTLEISGAASLSLPFDEPTCTNQLGSSNFSLFWRDSTDAHVFVLVAQMLGTYTGPGTYDGSAVTVKLQEEAGGQGRYFASQDGDTVAFTIDHVGEDGAWGQLVFSSLDGGAITASPMPVPLWCPTVQQ